MHAGPDPAAQAAYHYAAIDEHGIWLSRNNVCGDCHRCEHPEPGMFRDATVGWCVDSGEFVSIEAVPYDDYGCERWVAC